MLRTCLAIGGLLCFGFAGARLYRTPSAHAQPRAGGAPLKKAWGPVRSAYTEPRTGELWIVFEDTAGTVRLTRVYTGNGARADCPVGGSCVDVIHELQRD